MADFAAGALNALEIFRVTDTGSAYTLETGVGDSILLRSVVSGTFQVQEGLITINQIQDNKAFYDFILANQTSGEAVEPVSTRLTDGTEVRGIIAGGDTKLVAVVNYGVAKDGTRKVAVMLGRLQNSGNWTEEFNVFSSPTLEIQGVQPAYNVVFDSVLRDTAPTAWVATTATASITAGNPTGFDVKYLDLPA